ncbi:MAG: sulfatase-like hydrolase/transferase [Planctomycetes bacterium]|nr:sulfatase-like hydrolase/transferase [Planctomycetota bacterium]
MTERRLNLIILTSDELRADCVGFNGNADIKTPNLDDFAGRNVVFSRHFAVHGKCVPSRISMVTGRYPHTEGFRTINQHLPGDHPDLLMALKRQGYESAVFGHNHVWENFWGENKKSGGCVDYHSYTEGYFASMIERQWPVRQPAASDRKPMELSKLGFHYSGRIEKPLGGFCDDNRVEQAIHYLRQVRDRSRPFYLHVNISAPHPGYQVEEPYFSMYDRDAIRAWPHDLPRNAPIAMRKMREVRTGLEIPPDAFREVQAVYYGMVTKVDFLLGRLLDEIRAQGLLDDTVVVFTTDHGDFAGQYGLVEKWDTCMADCILRTPLILHAPRLGGGKKIDSLTEHVDICPTLLELLNVKPDWGIHGRSLLPTVAGSPGKDAVFADGGHEDEMFGRFNFRPGRELDGKQVTYRDCPESMARVKMVRTDTHKLAIRLAGGNELYDLRADPWEMDNRWGDPSLNAVLVDLQQKMIDWCIRTDTDRPFQKDVGA